MKLLRQSLGQRRLARVRPPVPPVARIAFNMRPIFAAWGGGNQWLLQMSRYLQYCGYHVQYDLRGEVDGIFMNHGGLTGKLSISAANNATFTWVKKASKTSVYMSLPCPAFSSG